MKTIKVTGNTYPVKNFLKEIGQAKWDGQGWIVEFYHGELVCWPVSFADPSGKFRRISREEAIMNLRSIFGLTVEAA